MSKPPAQKRASAVALSEKIDRHQFGPAMQKLTRQQQDFVVAYWQSDNQTEAARVAGYSTTNVDTTKAVAWKLAHNPKIKAAIQEFGGNVLTSEGVKRAVGRLLGLIESEDEKIALGAVKTLLDRTGIVAATQHNVNVEITLTREEKVAKLAELAVQAGLDPNQVLGNVVDVEFEDIEETEDDG